MPVPVGNVPAIARRQMPESSVGRFSRKDYLMQRVLALVIVCSLLIPCCGCTGEKRPTPEPNFKPTTNPSDIVVPEQMKKMAPGGAKK